VTDLPFSFQMLAKDLSDKMKKEDKSLREAAEDIGCSAATLSRMLKGDQAENQPDTNTLLRAVSWVGKRLADYESANMPKTSSIAEVEVHLRALAGLTDKDKDVLVAMVRAAHDQYGSRGKKK
jgi:transcriptional regulator with XRE-family HTH domain